VVVRQTLFNEFLGPIGDLRFLRKNYFPRIQDCLIPHEGLLRFVVSERLLAV